MFRFIGKVLIGIIVIKFLLVWIIMPALLGYTISKAEVCPEIDFEQLVEDKFDTAIDEAKLNIPQYLYPYIELRRWQGHLQLKVFQFIFELTSGCDLS